MYRGDVEVRQWCKGDPFPPLGKCVGIDTETELITKTMLDPPLVVYGLFDPTNHVCWIVYWYDAPEFMQYVNNAEVQQRFFNVGFDEMVCDNDDVKQSLMTAIDNGRVRDMMIRYHLWLLATAGEIPEKHHSSLKDVSKRLLDIELDKGEADDPNSHRLTFRRYNDDGSIYEITEQQAVYLAWDCISTWAIGQVAPEQPTEVQHTKGMCVLAHISRNGEQIDPVVFDALESHIDKDMADARERLMAFGFPDPEKENRDGRLEKKLLYDSMKEFAAVTGKPDLSETLVLTKKRFRYILAYAYDYAGTPGMVDQTAQVIQNALSPATPEKEVKWHKLHREVYADVLEKYNFLQYDSTKSKTALIAMLGAFVQDAARQLSDKNTVYRGGFCFAEAINKAIEYIDEHPWLLESKANQKGPRRFFQDHVNALIAKYPKLQLDTTKKSKQWKLAKDDKWRLEDQDIHDGFLDAYTDYYHLRKYKSTYLNREYIAEDGKVHPHYKNLVRTSRTSCSAPNAQNFPSRDKVYPLKNMFTAYPGMILCTTDFSFIELCGFAQSCWSRFHVSTMRDIINAGIDPHRWFAGVMNKVIDTDLQKKDDPEWVRWLNDYLKEKIKDEVRQLAKEANFGFPGALGAKRFYIGCRSKGIKITMDDAIHMRDEWIKAFPEMRFHMNPEKCIDTGKINMDIFGHKPAAWYEEEEEDIDDEEYEEEYANGKDDTYAYCAKLPCGQIRNRCSYNAACNAQFQGTVAVGAKLAGWNLLTAGYGQRICGFVHDEYKYCLYPHEMQYHIPIIERLMIDGMKQVIPDVKVGVETSCMLHWDKKATVFNKVEWNDDGTPILTEPPYVQNLINQGVTLHV